MKTKKYKQFRVETYTKPQKKTSIFTLFNKKTGDEYGEIRWHPPTGQYCFFPIEDNRLNLACMTEILSFMKDIFAGRRKIGNN